MWDHGSGQNTVELQWLRNEVGYIHMTFQKWPERQVMNTLAYKHGFNFILFLVWIFSPILLYFPYVWNIYNWGR